MSSTVFFLGKSELRSRFSGKNYPLQPILGKIEPPWQFLGEM
jgi:hypothetical protein